MKTLKLLIPAIAGLFLCALSAQADITTGLEGYWTLGDGPGKSTVTDGSGNNNTGTLVNYVDTATYNDMWTNITDPMNLDSYALTFFGTNATYGNNTCVSIPDSTSLDAPTTAHAWTLAAWVNCAVNGTNEPQNAGIVCKGILGVEQYALYINNGHFVADMRNAGNSGGQTVTSTIVPNSNTWYHVVVTFTTAGGTYHLQMAMYINGIFNANSPANTYTTTWSTNQPVYIGAHETTTGIIATPFEGIIDQVRIYNRALSPGDVFQMYQNGNYWDQGGSKSGTGSGGSGSWDSSTPNWWSAASSADTVWPANHAAAYFGGTAGTVMLNANESAEQLLFTTAGYIISQGAGSPVLTLTNAFSGGATIAVTPGISTISCPIAGTQGLTVGGLGLASNVLGLDTGGGSSGSGTLVLSGANTYTGVTTLNPGTVVNLGIAETAGTSGPLGDSLASNPGSIALAGGILQYSSANQNDYSGRFSTVPGQAYNVDVNGQSITFATALTSSYSSLTLWDSTGGGILNIQNTSSTIGGSVTVVGGTLELNSASALSASTIMTLPSSAPATSWVNLNFAGTQTVSALNINGVSESAGTYGSTSSSAVNQLGAFSGTGVLNVTGSVASPTYWDPGLTKAYAGSGGSGSWDSTSSIWYAGTAGSDGTWPANTIAYFAGTNGDVILNASESAAGLTFLAPGYVIGEPVAGNLILTLSGTGPQIIAPAGITTLDCNLAGSGLVFGGAGTFMLSGTNNSFVGATISPGATVQMNILNFGAVPQAATIVDNGTLNANIAASTLSNTITGNGVVNIIETVSDNLSVAGPMSSFTGTLNIPVSPGGNAKAQMLTTAVSLNKAATVNVANGGTLYMANNVLIPAPVNVFGIGNNETYGALRIESGATISGPVTLFGNATMGGGTGIGTISGAIGDGGNGYSLTKTVNAGALSLSGTNTYSGPTTIIGGILAISGSGSLGSGLYAANITDNAFFVYSSSATQTLSGVVGGTGAITNNGPGTLILNNSGNFNSGNITLNGGILDVPNQHPIGDGLSSSSIVFNGGTLENDDTTVGDDFALSYGLVLAANGGTLSTPTAGQSLLIPNLISGTGSLTKIGLGEIALSDADTFSGATIISGGALGLSGTGTIANSPNIIVVGGATFDVSGLTSTFALGSSQTLSNSTSTAVINGSASSGSGALSLTYAAGTPSFGVANGTLTLSATTGLKVNNTGAALGLGTYTLIGTNVNGVVAGTVPSSYTIGGGGIQASLKSSLIISASNTLDLVVAPSVNTNPTNIVFSVTNGQMTLSWPADHIGWQLQAQTNSVAVGISTNWANVSGSTTTNQVVVPVNLANGCVFYRLIYL